MADSETALGWRAVAVYAGERLLLSFTCREVNGGKVWSFAVPERGWWGDYADQDPRTAITKMMAMGGWTLEQILEPGQPTPAGVSGPVDTVAAMRARGMRANPPRLVAVTPPRVWRRWPNLEGPWWMNTVREGTVAVVADGSFLPGEFHVRRCDDITGQYLDYDATDDALFTELDAAPEPTRQPATKGGSR